MENMPRNCGTTMKAARILKSALLPPISGGACSHHQIGSYVLSFSNFALAPLRSRKLPIRQFPEYCLYARRKGTSVGFSWPTTGKTTRTTARIARSAGDDGRAKG